MSVSEATDWSKTSGTGAKYKTLNCNIEWLSPEDLSFQVAASLFIESKIRSAGIQFNAFHIFK